MFRLFFQGVGVGGSGPRLLGVRVQRVLMFDEYRRGSRGSLVSVHMLFRVQC